MQTEPGKHGWFVVHTKPRQEQLAEEHLARQGFECFLPRTLNPCRRLKRRRVEPMFPRYLFLRADTAVQNISSVGHTRGVSRLVKFGTRLAQAPEWVVERLKRATDQVSGLVRLAPLPFARGDRVDVFDGPFAGLRAIFQTEDGDSRALLLVQLLGREITVAVNRANLRPAR